MCVWQWCSEEITKYISDNLPYVFCEQIGKEIRDISDEIPFEIPDSWEWVRLGSIVYNRGQMKPTSDFCYVDIGSIDNKRQRLGDTENIITPDKAPSRAKKIIDVGDIIYSTVRPYLHNMCIIDRQFSLQPIASTGFATMTCYSGLLNKYLFYYLLAPDFDNYANDTENSKGVAYPAINDDRLYKALIPLPPLSEQHRIVAKIEELLPYIERYGKAEEHITALNTTFPEALKKSILQEAVQGKLVPQDPDDEPASVLLERIRVEKQKLIKAGKIKKSKHESVIVTRDKIPYEIPDSWVWCKLSDLAILENGDRSSKYPVEADYVEIGIPFFGAKDIDGDMMSFQNVRFISQQKYDELGNGKLVDGDIICLLRGSVGKTAKFEANEQFDTGFICAQMLIIRLLDKSLFGYISSYFKSPDYTNYVESKVTGTAVRQMPAKEMGNLLIPLPPLAEQHRIVAKIEEIMPMIERLTLR
ncbi:restriction endonuclease subunit S [Ruminococcus sp. AF17-1AC]|uniref:restriction endonuclease subunit S n=2 Tax=unclassified Ruminococcus TaxID=2608920 RepID=UPI000E500A32|nr:restriction endonuclease subunit S [Ruminococcus sp. AF17-1AC]RGG80906.1 restriction endonuclease subunit S [Ruminococcus sp. AF17-1AC]